MAVPPQIRPIVIALFLHEGRLLVSEGYDPTKRQRFYRPLGGAIEFGEYAEQALRREMREELGVDITDLRYLGMIENLFTFDGAPGHEIVLIYDALFEDRQLYQNAVLTGDEGGEPFVARWMEPPAFDAITPIYPDGLLKFLYDRGLLVTESRS